MLCPNNREDYSVGKVVKVAVDSEFGPGFYYKAGDFAVIEGGTENGTGRIEDEDKTFVLVRFTSGEHKNSQQYIPYNGLELPTMTYILLGSDDYIARTILDVYSTREKAQEAIDKKTHMLISRQGEPKREIIEKEVL